MMTHEELLEALATSTIYLKDEFNEKVFKSTPTETEFRNSGGNPININESSNDFIEATMIPIIITKEDYEKY